MLKRVGALFLLCAALLFSGAAPAFVPLYDFCRTHRFLVKFDLNHGFFTVSALESQPYRSVQVYLSMPYLVSGGEVFYLSSTVRVSEKGEVELPPEYAEKIRLLLKPPALPAPVQTNLPVLVATNTNRPQALQSPTNEKDDKIQNPVYNKEVPFRPIDAIIIDAGHGGKDPGGLGVDGVKEKEIVYSIARMLEGYLKQDKRFRVFLTRKGDYFVTLEDRTRLSSEWAKTYNPIFVSIHGNISFVKSTEGVEVYFLSDKASDEEALNVERMENAGFSRADIEKTEALYQIIADLVKDGVRMESSMLSAEIHDAVVRQTGAPGRGVKKAPFYVLKYNPVPATLVEVGFLSHKKESKKLKTREYQRQIALGLYRGISRFVEKYNQTRGFSK